jgi:uncharacterized membrane protein YfcA
MADIALLLALVAVGVVGGSIAGLGGPGGIPVILALNLLLVLPAPVSAATASGIFIVATIVTTGLYQHSDGIDWPLAATVGVPAVGGTYIGTWVADWISEAGFELVLGGVFFLIAAGIVYREQTAAETRPDTPRRGRWLYALVAVLCLWVGIVAGITGIGGPAIVVPLLILLGIRPIRAIGAAVAAGVLITSNATLGHLIQGNAPELLGLVFVGIPYVCSQLLGWRYVHVVSGRTVSYTIAALGAVGAVVIVL